ncbi:MAG: DUF4173 domain-containing protein [Chloroflexota bacterium]
MKQHTRLVWITVLVLGWLLDFLFWKQAPGINFALYCALCLAAGAALLRLDGARMAPRAAWLLPLIAIFALASFLRAEPFTLFLAVLLTLFLMAVLAITCRGGRWLGYSLADYALGLMRLTWSVLTKPFGFRAPTGTGNPARRSTASGAWPVVRGLLLALPILMLFAALLGSADLVFRRELDGLIKLLSLERLPEYIFRLIYTLIAALALLGVFLHASSESKDERLLGHKPPLASGFLGFTEASIVLGGVAILFLAFVIVQFRYFFGGAENIGLDGFTFAEYARRGYGELMTVAILSLLLLLGLGAVTRRDSISQQRLFSALSVMIVLLVGVMLVSAYMRLSLYEMAYGFTRLRTYVHVSLIWLGLLIGAVVVLELLRRERLFAAAALIASLGFAVTLIALNVDAFIVRQNVDRARRGQGLDVPHLASLSTDSVPPLVALFQSEAIPSETKDALGAALACRLESQPPRGPSDWRSFTVSQWQAVRALESVRADLEDYKSVQDDWFTRVFTPKGTSHDCIVFRD